ncbi:MAG: LCP family protein [Actinomycetota bacterium]|nr:LCP family protein [Actinomycetota bacterium]
MSPADDETSVLPGMQGEPVEAPRKRRSRLAKSFAVLGGIVVLVVGVSAVAVTVLADRYDQNVQRIPDVFTKVPAAARPQPVVAKSTNIVLVGSDSRAGQQTTGSGGNADATSPIGQRSDTLMVVHLDAGRKNGWVISFPRDSWVDIPGHGKNKINAAFAFGGPSLLIQTIEELTQIHIDHYMQIDFDGFKNMTDAVGGVDVNVPTAFRSGQYNFHQGRQHINGEQALQFVRERHSLPSGDFDRIRNQQAFLRALMGKATSQGSLFNPVRLNSLLGAVSRSVSVDDGLSGGALRSLALSLRSLGGDNVTFLTVPVTGTGRVGAASVVFLDAAADRRLYDAARHDTMAAYHR